MSDCQVIPKCVTLSWHEVLMAAQVAVTRQVAAMKNGLPDKHGIDPSRGWGSHIEGACGELAVAKATGRFWAGSINTFKTGGDVGAIQVRTRSKEGYDLIVRPDDRDEDLFVLVIGMAPTYRVCGWLRGADAKQGKWLKSHGNRPPAYFAPVSSLKNMATLPDCNSPRG